MSKHTIFIDEESGNQVEIFANVKNEITISIKEPDVEYPIYVSLSLSDANDLYHAFQTAILELETKIQEDNE